MNINLDKGFVDTLPEIGFSIRYKVFGIQNLSAEIEKYLSDYDRLGDVAKRNLVILATYVDQCCLMYNKKCPPWVLDNRLILSEPYFVEGYDSADFIMAYQSEFNHNVFLTKDMYKVE